jgi:hypothetical protein
MPKRDREAVTQGLNQILSGSETGDLLGNVIRNDRHRAGRPVSQTGEEDNAEAVGEKGNSATDDIMTSHTVIGQYDNMTNKQGDNNADMQSDNRTIGQTDKQASPSVVGQPELSAAHPRVAVRREGKRKQERETGDLLEGRISEAERMAESGTTTVTLRIPRELNDWLDEYVHRAWPERVRKQELVIEGLRLLFARRGRPGEPVLQTPLLPE